MTLCSVVSVLLIGSAYSRNVSAIHEHWDKWGMENCKEHILKICVLGSALLYYNFKINKQKIISLGSVPNTQSPITTTKNPSPVSERRQDSVNPSPDAGMCQFSWGKVFNHPTQNAFMKLKLPLNTAPCNEVNSDMKQQFTPLIIKVNNDIWHKI
jgi:hypothetical protein